MNELNAGKMIGGEQSAFVTAADLKGTRDRMNEKATYDGLWKPPTVMACLETELARAEQLVKTLRDLRTELETNGVKNVTMDVLMLLVPM